MKLKMIRALFLTLLATFVTASFLFGANIVQASDKIKYNWRCQTFEPSAELWIAKDIMSSIQKASGGRLNINMFAGGELFPSPEILKAVGSGMIEMGIGFGGYWPSRVDVANIESGLPMTWQNIDQAFDIFFCRGMIDIVREDYKKQNVYWWPKFGSRYSLISSKPVTNLADMKGMKIRAAGPTSLLLKSVGVATTYVPFEEVYMGLATGTIDGAIMGPLSTYKIFKLHEVAKYYSDFSFMLPVTNAFINLKKWESLPEDLKEIVDLAMFKNTFQIFKNHTMEEYKLRREMTQSGELVITQMDDESIKILQTEAKKIFTEEAKKSDQASQCTDIIIQMLDDYGALE